ncbi:hypothetical protein KR018_008343, partial [Drosophila ironensis]
EAMTNNEPGARNLMDELEEAFESCVLSLTKQEPNSETNKEEIELEAQETTNKFIAAVGQMEAFFLQKRIVASKVKPHMKIQDENEDLRIEIQRKDALLKKHYNHLEKCKESLSNIRVRVYKRPKLPIGHEMIQGGAPGGMPPLGGPAMMQGGDPGGMPPMGGMQPSPQHLLQAQQMQQLRMMDKLPPQ